MGSLFQTALIIAIFATSVVLMYRKKMSTLIGLPVMALAIAFAAAIPITEILNEVIAEGATRLSHLVLVVIFGAALAELVKRSGIVEVLIKNTAEFFGDRIYLVSLLMMFIIAALSTVLAGLGAVIMVGTVVFPILISLGISKNLAASIFLIGLSLGGMLNLINWEIFIDVLKLNQGDVMHYVLWYFPAALLLATTFVVWELRKQSATSFKLQIPETRARAQIGLATYFTPMVPVVLIFGSGIWKLFHPISSFEFPILGAMFIGIVYGAATLPKSAGPKIQVLTRSLFDGIAAVAPAIALMIGIGMLLKAVAHPHVKVLLLPLIQICLPSSGWKYILFFTLAAPLSLYRGPLNIWGMGSGLLVLMKETGTLGAAPIMAAVLAVGQLQGVSDPTNTYNVWIANYLGIDVIKIMKKTLPIMWLTTWAGLLIAARIYF